MGTGNDALYGIFSGLGAGLGGYLQGKQSADAHAAAAAQHAQENAFRQQQLAMQQMGQEATIADRRSRLSLDERKLTQQGTQFGEQQDTVRGAEGRKHDQRSREAIEQQAYDEAHAAFLAAGKGQRGAAAMKAVLDQYPGVDPRNYARLKASASRGGLSFEQTKGLIDLRQRNARELRALQYRNQVNTTGRQHLARLSEAGVAARLGAETKPAVGSAGKARIADLAGAAGKAAAAQAVLDKIDAFIEQHAEESETGEVLDEGAAVQLMLKTGHLTKRELDAGK